MIPEATPVHENVIGRFNLDVMGRHRFGVRDDLGKGWRGDRMECVEHPGGLATVWTVCLESIEQAERLANEYRNWATREGQPLTVHIAGPQVTVMVGVPDERREAVLSEAERAFV
jgi:hypothetical protein